MYGTPPGSGDVRGRAARTSRRVILRALDMPGLPAATAVTAQAAFDALYVYAAPALVQQTYLLTGSRRLAFESTEQAFHQAWERWPEVARDPDPVGWVREQAHEYALSPWHRFRWLVTPPGPQPSDPVWQAFLALRPLHRRAVLLCDGLGLSVGEAAAETHASTPATRNRLVHARAVLHERLQGEDVPRQWIRQQLLQAQASTLPQPWSVRDGSERRVRALTRTVALVTAALIGWIAVTVATTPGHYESVDRPRTTHDRTSPAGPPAARSGDGGVRQHACAAEAPSRFHRLTPPGCLGDVAGQ